MFDYFSLHAQKKLARIMESSDPCRVRKIGEQAPEIEPYCGFAGAFAGREDPVDVHAAAAGESIACKNRRSRLIKTNHLLGDSNLCMTVKTPRRAVCSWSSKERYTFKHFWILSLLMTLEHMFPILTSSSAYKTSFSNSRYFSF